MEEDSRSIKKTYVFVVFVFLFVVITSSYIYQVLSNRSDASLVNETPDTQVMQMNFFESNDLVPTASVLSQPPRLTENIIIHETLEQFNSDSEQRIAYTEEYLHFADINFLDPHTKKVTKLASVNDVRSFGGWSPGNKYVLLSTQLDDKDYNIVSKKLYLLDPYSGTYYDFEIKESQSFRGWKSEHEVILVDVTTADKHWFVVNMLEGTTSRILSESKLDYTIPVEYDFAPSGTKLAGFEKISSDDQTAKIFVYDLNTYLFQYIGHGRTGFPLWIGDDYLIYDKFLGESFESEPWEIRYDGGNNRKIHVNFPDYISRYSTFAYYDKWVIFEAYFDSDDFSLNVEYYLYDFENKTSSKLDFSALATGITEIERPQPSHDATMFISRDGDMLDLSKSEIHTFCDDVNTNIYFCTAYWSF